LTSYEGGQRYKVIRNEAGEETGIEVSGVLTTFDVPNANGTEFTKESYDKFVDEYFIAHSVNVPLVLYHNDTDPRTVAGIVKKLTKTKEGVELVGWIPRTAYYYNLIKAQIAEGILQGFSNAGGMRDYEWDEENNAIKVKDFALLHASLVATPADTGALLEAQNTAFSGFGGGSNFEAPIDNEVNPKNNPENPKPFELIL
ncbi:MAG: hypothetical protein IIV15_07435, partial [Ruminococcus sp.]|nr:hypothetical protein [Ruminococcus sp.]